MGTLTWLKKGAPTVIFSSVKASEITGKRVPQRTAKSRASRIQLLSRKALSREAKDSSRCSALRSFRRTARSAADPARISARKATK